MARTRSFSAPMQSAARAQSSAARTVERGMLRQQKTGQDFWGTIVDIGRRALGGGGGRSGGPVRPPPPTFGGPITYQPPPSNGGGGGGACDRLPSFMQQACRNLAVGTGGGGGTFQPVDPCPSPLIRNPLTGGCIDPTALPPGGRPAFVGSGGNATEGAFGLPAMTPAQTTRTRLECPTGMVLGKDNLCYPKAILSSRSKFRKWRPSPRPKVSAAEWRTLQRAARVKERAKDVAQEAGFKVTKR